MSELYDRIQAILKLALKYSGSDIDIRTNLTSESGTTIDMRVDGQMRRIKSKLEDDKLISYLCQYSNLNPGKRFDAQTSNFEMEVNGQILKLRFAVLQGQNYSNAILRILNA